MKIFRYKPQKVRAVQFIDLESVNAILDLIETPAANVDVIRSADGEVASILIYNQDVRGQRGRGWELNPTDWIIEREDQSTHVFTAEEFASTFDDPEFVSLSEHLSHGERTVIYKMLAEEMDPAVTAAPLVRDAEQFRIRERVVMERKPTNLKEADQWVEYILNGIEKNPDLHDQTALDRFYTELMDSLMNSPSFEDVTTFDEFATEIVDRVTKAGVRFKDGKVLEP